MKSKLFTLFTLCSAISMNVQAETKASAINDKKITLFSSAGQLDTPYRIPAIATMSNGQILAIGDHRPCGADIGNGEVDIYAKISTNNGASWTPSSTTPNDDGSGKIAEGTSSNGYGDAAVVAHRDTSEVVVICVSGKVKYADGTSSSHNTMARLYSSDNGKTWAAPEDVTKAFFDNLLPNAYTMFMASGRMLQSTRIMKNGYWRIYGALLVKELSGEKNYVVYSDDFGKTWSLLGDACITDNLNEAKLEELPNGLLISSRTEGGRIFNVFTFTDELNGQGSWTDPVTHTFESGAVECNGELLKYEGVTDADGKKKTILLQSLPTGTSFRSNLAVYYKEIDDTTAYTPSDFTTGWTKGIEVDSENTDHGSGYSTMTIMPNGEIGFFYEDNLETLGKTCGCSDLASIFGHSCGIGSGGSADLVFVSLTVSEITGDAYTYTAPTEEVKETVATPTFSPASGEVAANTTVTITCTTEGATIYYTTDGTEPTSASTTYSGAITITEAVTIKAIAVKEGCTDSEVATATYTVKTTTEEGGGETGGGETEGGDTGSEDTTTPEVGTTKQWPMWVMTTSDCTGSCPSSSYATLYLPYAVKLPSNVIAFYGTLNEANTELTIYKITSGIVPKNCAVILEDMDARESITLEVVADSEAPTIENNNLKGTTGALDISTNHDSYYVFGHGTTHFGFFLNADNTIPAGKAYLELTTVETKARSIVITRGDTEGTTAIAPLPAVDDAASAPEYYTLQGVKVDIPTRGIYIMKHHGQTRKVVVR